LNGWNKGNWEQTNIAWSNPPPMPPPTSWGGNYQQSPWTLMWGTRQDPPTSEQWTDERHPTIIQLMGPVADRYRLDNPSLSSILNHCGKRIPNIPSIDGVPTLCWGHALGRCKCLFCKYPKKGGHIGRAAYTDAWASIMCQLLQPGITKLLETNGAVQTTKK
jgi:hypothetical protein